MTHVIDRETASAFGKYGRTALLTGASALVLSAFAPAAFAQDADEGDADETIMVTGIRGALERAMDIKRDANGVVDAISAEDIGKFPDTNLAESLQRITGVSIDRVNGEGSLVTVRGFGPGFNLVTLNGRTLPTADVQAIGVRGNYGAGGSRSFDFSNLASEGVSGLEVYKTGQAVLPSGGLGATVNIKTRRPLDMSAGFSGTVQAKAILDQSVENRDDITPELSGLVNWTDDTATYGVSLFGSWARRDSGANSALVNDWITRRADAAGNIDGSYTRGDGSTIIENGPAPGQLYAVPQDSRLQAADISRERLNAQLVAQFRPTDTLTFTADYTFVRNDNDELRYENTNWYATPMDHIIFDNNNDVATAVYVQEFNNGTKDMGFEQTNRATRDEMHSFGFNADWEVFDGASIVLDAHSSSAESGGNNPLGHTATFVAIAAPVILSHSTDYRSGYPEQNYFIDDTIRGDGNGVLSPGDLGTQVSRYSESHMEHDVNEIDLRFEWEFDNSKLTVGGNYRDTEMTRQTETGQQDLGSWGVGNPGDVEQYAPGLVTTYCLECQFEDLPTGLADVSFKADAVPLFNIFTPLYEGMGNDVNISRGFDVVSEEISSLFAQFEMQGEFLGHPAYVNFGLRYEDTNVDSSTKQSVPSFIRWTADNDFLVVQSGAAEDVSGSGSYDHWLPNIDFKVDLTDNLVARASYSKTIGRVGYTSLFASTTANAPNRPTAFGGTVTGSSQNPGLLPLESDNYDLAVEWYYGDASYFAVTYFNKKVANFIGTGVVDRNLFGLRDAASGAAGSRSGDALDVINDLGVDQSEANLFTLTALIDANGGNVAAARAEFEANLVGNALPQDYVDAILAAYDVDPNASDPLYTFAVSQPINNREGNIDGLEIAWQHFFWDTGFGMQANYTMVNGDVELDPASDPGENQFALVGLSDTANFTAIYENYGFSARLAYNWRDEYLSATNQGGDRSGQFVEAFGQLDLSVSYDVTEAIQVAFEGINLTGEDIRQYTRVPNQVVYAYELDPRYSIGARYKW